MRISSLFERPEYVFRPSQVVRRLMAELHPPAVQEFVRLPWGVRLEFVGTDRWIGRSLRTLGIDDLPLCEVVWRLVRPGSVCVDVGANVGLLTTLMAIRAGPSGRVVAFEPHPRTFEILTRNVVTLRQSATAAPVTLHRAAVGETCGEAMLREPESWERNNGCVSVSENSSDSDDYNPNELKVPLVRLGDTLKYFERIDLLKIDVEGYQDKVIAGAFDMLRKRRIKHVIYEVTAPNELSGHLLQEIRALGYSSWIIDSTFWGPLLRDPDGDPSMVQGRATNVLLSMDVAAVERATRYRGWGCLRGS